MDFCERFIRNNVFFVSMMVNTPHFSDSENCKPWRTGENVIFENLSYSSARLAKRHPYISKQIWTDLKLWIADWSMDGLCGEASSRARHLHSPTARRRRQRRLLIKKRPRKPYLSPTYLTGSPRFRALSSEPSHKRTPTLPLIISISLFATTTTRTELRSSRVFYE